MMQLLKTQLKFSKLRPFIAVCLIQVALFFGLSLSNFGIADAQAKPLTLVAELYREKPLNLDEAADKSSDASQKVLEDIDTTKKVIGKTPKRNEFIERGREKASKKWNDLAEKAQKSQNSDESLSATEEQALKRFIRKD